MRERRECSGSGNYGYLDYFFILFVCDFRVCLGLIIYVLFMFDDGVLTCIFNITVWCVRFMMGGLGCVCWFMVKFVLRFIVG